MSLDFSLTIMIDTGGEPFIHELFSKNITHNLGNMARACGVHHALWQSTGNNAGSIITTLERGLKTLKDDSDTFEKYDSANGWGLYENFIPFIEACLEACKTHPKSIINASI